jgi:broad specificity phosphatase PhoE
MPTLIYLVRHGEIEPRAKDRFAGSPNVTLSAEGCRQVKALGEPARREIVYGH